MRRALTMAIAVAACAALVGGCAKESGGKGADGGAARAGAGVPIAGGQVADVRVVPDGQVAAFIAGGQKPRLEGIPPQMLVGKLRVAKVDGSGDWDLGEGVTNLPGGYVMSRDSRWVAFLAGFNPAQQVGTLHLADVSGPGKAPARVADGVSYVLFSPDSKWLAFVAGGVLRAGAVPGGPFVEVAGEVALADFAPSSAFLVARRKTVAGGALLKVEVGQWQAGKKLAEQVGDFAVSPDSRHVAVGVRSPAVHGTYDLHVASAPQWTARKVASSASAFAFSADAKYLARIEDQPPGPDQLGSLRVGPADGSHARKVAEKVHEFTFAPDSGAIAYLEAYREQARAGRLGVAALPAGEPKALGDLVPNFAWAPGGKSVAFLQRFLRPIFSVDLMVYRLGDEAAVKVEPGVYGYGFTPDGRTLLYRTACIRDGRACDLYARDLTAPWAVNDAGVAEGKGKKLATGVYGFFKASESGDRVLVTYARMDSTLYDVGVVNLKTAEHRTLGERTLLPPVFAARDGTRVVYAVADRARPGVYVASQVP